jgi:colanic acid biosynthesis protein WcaH
MKILPKTEYRKIMTHMPILCVDGILCNTKGQYLLVKRKNAPFLNQYWVPGGRVLKGENLEKALKRKMRQELGITIKKVKPVGYYEGTHLESGHWKLPDGMHAISVVFRAEVAPKKVKLDEQSSDWGWFDKLPKRFQVRSFTKGL